VGQQLQRWGAEKAVVEDRAFPHARRFFHFDEFGKVEEGRSKSWCAASRKARLSCGLQQCESLGEWEWEWEWSKADIDKLLVLADFLGPDWLLLGACREWQAIVCLCCYAKERGSYSRLAFISQHLP
jgi:hypothetical protein